MMKKTIFGKLVAIAMIFAGFSLTSCDEKDNAIINGQVWVKPEIQLVDGGAIITGSSTADINRMLGRVRQDIIQAAQNGKTFTIDIQTSVLNCTTGDNTLNIATVTGGDVVLNLPSNIVAEAPLIIQKQGVADDATAGPSDNKVEINFPATASNLDLGINMPNSTVTLKGGTFNNVAATTAWNTLVIEKDVTVNWLKINGGNAVVKDGGKVLGALTDNYFEVKKEGICINELWKNEVPTTKPTDEDYFYVNKAKILKREDGDRVSFNVWQYSEDPKNEVEIVISDGAKAETYVAFSSSNYKPAINIIGEGDAKLLSEGNKNEEGKIIPSNSSIELSGIKNMTNVTVDKTKCLVKNNVTNKYEELEIDKDCYTTIAPPQNAKDCVMKAYNSIGTSTTSINHKLNNCTLSAQNIQNIDPNSEGSTFKGNYISFSGTISGKSATTKGCKFEGTEDDPYSVITLPYQSADRSTFNYIFDNCQFSKGFKLSTSFVNSQPWTDKDGKPITKAYYWWVLNDDGSVKTDPYTEKRSVDEKDIPAANKANGKTNGSGWWDDTIGEWGAWVYSNGYWIAEDKNGLTENAVFNNYKCLITFENTTFGGKAITKDTEFINNVASGYNEKDEIATQTRFVIGGVSYKAVKDSDTQKWILVAAE